MHIATPATDATASGAIAPGSLRTPRDLLQDPVRTLVLVKARQAGLTLRDVSLRLGKAQGYMSVYLTKGYPHELPPMVRGKLAEMFDVDEEQLIQRAGAALPPDAFGTRHHSFVPNVPLYQENERLDDPMTAKRLIARPLATSTDVEGLVAVTLNTLDTDRVRVGDTVYLSPATPNAGDLVAVIRGDGLLRYIAEALSITQVAFSSQFCIVWRDDAPNMDTVTEPGTTLRKVVAILLR